MSPERVLVTGGSGFVGRHLVGALLPRARAVGVVARRAARGFPDGVETLAADCANAGEIGAAVRAFRPDAVVHLAGRASPREVDGDPEGGFAANALGTLNALTATAEVAPGVPFLLASSAHVYAPAAGARREEDPLGPSTLYGRTKAAAEAIGLGFARAGALEVRVARFFNLVGPGQGTDYAMASFAAQLAAIEAGKAPPLLRVGNLALRRDFLDVRDGARALAALLALPRGGERVFNVGSGTARPVGDLLESLLAHASVRPTVEVDASRVRGGEAAEIRASIERLAGATGFEPTVPLERSAADVLAVARAGA